MPSNTDPKTILLTGEGFFYEAEASSVITPGMLVERSGLDVQAHATANGRGIAAFALENSDVGLDIDNDYAIGDQVQFITAQDGSHVYAFLAAGQTVAAGDELVSDGAGALTTTTAATAAEIFARALEAVDNSGGVDPARIKVEVSKGHFPG